MDGRRPDRDTTEKSGLASWGQACLFHYVIVINSSRDVIFIIAKRDLALMFERLGARAVMREFMLG